MPLATIPAADVNACSGWTEQDRNLYNKLDFYFAKMQVDRRQTFSTWPKFFGKTKWTPNMGATMRSVMKEPSPHIRQFAFPMPIDQPSKKDVIQVRERRRDEVVYKHKFESLIFDFLPDFRDFMTDHVDAASKDIMEKQERFEDIFYRGRIFHRAPNVWIADGQDATGELVASPTGVGNAAGTDAKTTAWLQAMIAKIGPKGYLSLLTLNKMLQAAETDIRIPCFSGSDLPKNDQGMTGKFALVVSTEGFNQFSVDPFMLQYKNINMDIVNDRFKGSIFGRITCILEDMPLRMKVDGTFTAPEVVELNPDADNFGQSVPNPVYVSLDDATGSPYEWAFLVGTSANEVIEVGPPPSKFASNGMPKGFGKMFWNGEIEATKNILVPCVDDAGVVSWEPNKYGDKLQLISQTTYGIRTKEPRYVIPILFKRKRGQ